MSQSGQLDYLLTLAETDPVPRVRHYVLRCMVEQSQAIANSDLVNANLVHRLWALMM